MKGFKNYQFKSEEYIQEFYADIDTLIHAIKEYDRISGQKEELNLNDLLRKH